MELIQSAVAEPFTPDAAVKRMLLIGAFAGLLFSIAFVLIRYFLDGTIRSEFEVSMDLKLPVLGILPRAKGESARANQSIPPKHSETYNTLRTRFSRSGKHVIVVTAPGKCGAKSMVAEKLAKALAITREQNKASLLSEEFFLFEEEEDLPPVIGTSPRINIDYAEEYKEKHWRFFEVGSV